MRLSTISAVALVPLVAAAAIDNRAAIRRHHELQQRGAMDEFVSAILNPTDDPTSTAATSSTSSSAATSTKATTTLVSSTSERATATPTSGRAVTTDPSTASPSPHSTSSSSASPSPSLEPSSSSESPSPSPTPSPSSTSEEPSSTTSATPIETTTNAKGEAVTVTKTKSVTSIPSNDSSKSSKSSGFPTGAIIGIVVGVVVIALLIAAFLIFRCVRSRSNPDEPMRWPELNHHGDKAGNNVAVPAMMVTGDRRMSLSDEIDPEPLGDVDASHLPMYEKSIAGHQSLDDSHSEYTSYPPAVQHQQTYGEQYGGPYDWDGSDEGYAGMTRGSSPTMAGVGASNAVTYPQQAQPNTHHY